MKFSFGSEREAVEDKKKNPVTFFLGAGCRRRSPRNRYFPPPPSPPPTPPPSSPPFPPPSPVVVYPKFGCLVPALLSVSISLQYLGTALAQHWHCIGTS